MSAARANSERAPERCDLVVVGAGIVGLAVARELCARHPRASVCVLEREQRLAMHQSGHNSGVIHSGVYYAPGSLKARLCVEGARELYDYCERRGIPHRRSGKLIVATHRAELARLHELLARGRANGVPGVRLLDARGARSLEPHVRALAALHCPSTGVTDFAAVARSLAHDALTAGASLVTDCRVDGAIGGSRSLHVRHAQGVTEARYAIFCAGAWADRLARAAGAGADPRIVPFRGAYLRLAAERRALVRSLVYPVPNPSLPFLGVHLTRDVHDEVLIGPTALIAGARDAYRLRTVRREDLRDVLGWPGTWRVLARWWRTGLVELRNAALPGALARAAATMLPELDVGDTLPGFAGVRAQAVGRDGRLLEDFAFSRTDRALHVRNAPSPAATSALAIARHVAERAERAFDL